MNSRVGIIILRKTAGVFYLGILAVTAVKDLQTHQIEDKIPISLAVLALVSCWLFPEITVIDRVAGVIAVSLPMTLLAMKIPGAFGGGDIKLMAACGLFLGVRDIVAAMILAVFSGAAYIAVLGIRGKIHEKGQFAFGPFLALGLAAVFLWGDKISGLFF